MATKRARAATATAGQDKTPTAAAERARAAAATPVEIEPPRYRPCVHCGFTPTSSGEDHRFAFSQRFPESGFRRVFVRCQRCRGSLFFDEEIPKASSASASTPATSAEEAARANRAPMN